MSIIDKINGLQAGQSIELTKTEAVTCIAQRSEDGKKIIFIKEYNADSWQTIKNTQFS